MQEYRDFMQEQGHGEETLRARLAFARARWAEWGTWEVTGADLGRWLSGFNGWTKVTYYNHLRSLFDWLTTAGLVEVDPMAKMKRPPSPRPKSGKALTESELRRALEAASPDVRAFLMLGYLAGLRRFEIAKMRGEDITETGLYVMGKGGHGWTVPTHPLLWELAGQYPRRGWWFPSPHRHERKGMPISASSVGDRVGKLFRSIGLDGATHRARHTYGTQLLRGGANLRVVQELMRHSSLATTALYLGVDNDEKVLAIHGLLAA